MKSQYFGADIIHHCEKKVYMNMCLFLSG